MKEIKSLSVDLLTYQQERTDVGNLQALADNIRTYGLQHPLLVVYGEKRNNTYEIVDGRRRFEACKLAGFDQVACIELDQEDLSEDLALVLNTHRLNLNPVELYEMAVKYVKDEFKGDPLALPRDEVKALAAKLNVELNATYRLLNIGRMDKDVRAALAKGDIPLRLALLTINIEPKTRKQFLAQCIAQKPTTNDALDWLRYRYSGKAAERLGDALFDTEECATCRYRGKRDVSLFEDAATGKRDEYDDFCWNERCFNGKTEKVWQDAEQEAKQKLNLSEIKRGKFSDRYDHELHRMIIPKDPEKCKTCKQVKLLPVDGKFTVACPRTCANIDHLKKTSKKTSGETVAPKKGHKKIEELTADEKKMILKDRFAFAARKAMIAHFFRDGREFAQGKAPKDYRRILFFIGFDKQSNPFNVLEIWPQDFIDDDFGEKEEKDHAHIVRTLDLKQLAQMNIQNAAQHLASFDASGMTPERINVAIEILYGEANWCANHYDDIVAKLSKRSTQILEGMKRYRPAWAGAKKPGRKRGRK